MRSARLVSAFFSRRTTLSSQFTCRRLVPIRAPGAELCSNDRDRIDYDIVGVRPFREFNMEFNFAFGLTGSRVVYGQNYLHMGNSFFSTASNEIAVEKHSGESGKQTKDDIIKNKSVDEEITDTKILRSLVKYLWLNDNIESRIRVLLALGLLVGGKVINVQVPFLFKLSVDWLSVSTGSSDAMASFTDSNSTLLALFVSPSAVLIGYGIARVGASACSELRNAVFSKVALSAIF